MKVRLWKLVHVATQQSGNDSVHLLNTSACGYIALWSIIVLLVKKLYKCAELTQEPLTVTNWNPAASDDMSSLRGKPQRDFSDLSDV